MKSAIPCLAAQHSHHVSAAHKRALFFAHSSARIVQREAQRSAMSAVMFQLMSRRARTAQAGIGATDVMEDLEEHKIPFKHPRNKVGNDGRIKLKRRAGSRVIDD